MVSLPFRFFSSGPSVYIYLFDFAYESADDSVNNFLHKVASHIMFDQFFLKCVNKHLTRCWMENQNPKHFLCKTGHGIVCRIVQRIGHV
jgi:hypothetical protein